MKSIFYPTLWENAVILFTLLIILTVIWDFIKGWLFVEERVITISNTKLHQTYRRRRGIVYNMDLYDEKGTR